MMRKLNFCPAAIDARWQLSDKLNFGLPIVLLTWSHDAIDVDGGPPTDVSQALAQAMVQGHWVSFLVADETLPAIAQGAGSTSVQSVTSHGLVSSLSARWHAEPAHWNWLSTRDAAVAATLFNQPGFDWSLQAQVVLLSAVDVAAPVLTLEWTQALWRGGSPDAVDELVAAGVQAVLRPGVDGVVVGAVGFQAGTLPALLQATRAQCQATGWVLNECAESAL